MMKGAGPPCMGEARRRASPISAEEVAGELGVAVVLAELFQDVDQRGALGEVAVGEGVVGGHGGAQRFVGSGGAGVGVEVAADPVGAFGQVDDGALGGELGGAVAVDVAAG